MPDHISPLDSRVSQRAQRELEAILTPVHKLALWLASKDSGYRRSSCDRQA